MKRISILRYGGFVFSVGGARVVSVLITSVTFPYIVRHLGVEMYGLWSYVLAIGAFLDSVADPGLTVYATQHVAAGRQAGFDQLSDILVLRVLSAAVAIAILLVIASFEVRPDLRLLLRVYGIGFFLMNLAGSDYLLGALEMFHARSVLAVAQQTIFAGAIFIFLRSPKDVLWLPVSVLGSTTLTNLVGWFILWRQGFRLAPSLRPERWKKILVPSGHYAVSSLMSSFYHRTGHIVVRFFLGDHALGIYAAAVRFVDLLRNFVVVVLNVLMPRMALAAKSCPGLNRLARFAATIVAVLSIPLTAGLISTAHIVVPWVLGAKFMEDVPLLRWMSLYVMTASAASLLAGTILYVMGRHRAYLASTAGGAAAGVLLYLVLTPTLGLTGAGLAFVLAELVVAAIAYSLLPGDLRDSWKNPLIGVALLAGLLMAAAVRLVASYDSQAWVVISAGAVVYILACGWFVRRWLIQQLEVTS